MSIDLSRFRRWVVQLGFIAVAGPLIGYAMAVAARSLIEASLGW